MRKAKTLVAVPSAQEWKILFPRAPYSKTLEHPYAVNRLFDAACVGIGIVNFVSNLTKLICTKKYFRVIVVGIAGALPHSGLKTGDLVRVDQECVGDIGYWNGDEFRSFFQKPQVFSATSAKFAPLPVAKLPGVRGISVNTLTSSESALEYRAKFFGAQVEAMEAVAAFQISQTLGAQIFEVRAISNFTGDMDKNRWNFKQSLLSLKNNVLLPMWENVK